jgi:D-alanine-D-alanine ligase
MNIGVLFGGISVEHDISIISAIQVIKALDKNKYQVIPIYITKQGEFLSGKRYSEIETYKNVLKPKKVNT